MQLSKVKMTKASGLVRTLLRVAHRLEITDHNALAAAIGVDHSSMIGVLQGGFPNARTAERYQKFIRKHAGRGDITDSYTQAAVPPKAAVIDRPGKTKALEATRVSSPVTRRPASVEAPAAATGISLVRQLEQLNADLGEIAETATSMDDHVREFARLREHMNVAVQRVRLQATQLLTLALSWDKDPFIKEVLTTDANTRRVLAQVLKLANPGSMVPNIPARTKKTTAQREVKIVHGRKTKSTTRTLTASGS